MEYIDVYDEHRKFLNKTIERRETLEDGEFRLAVSVLVINKENKILTTLRSPQKHSYPDKWENTTGGVVSGETMLDAAVRELFEETGIIANKDELIKLAEFQSNDLLFDTFLLYKDINIEEIRLDPEETVDAKFVTVEEYDEMIADDLVLEPQARAYKEILKVIMNFALEFEEYERVSSYINGEFEIIQDAPFLTKLKEKYKSKITVSNKNVDDVIESFSNKFDLRKVDFSKEYRLQYYLCKTNAYYSYINAFIKLKDYELEVVGYEITFNEKSERYFKDDRQYTSFVVEKRTGSIFTDNNLLNREFRLELGLSELDIEINCIAGYLQTLEDIDDMRY